MKRPTLIGAAVGLLVGIPWLALAYAGQLAAGLPLVPFDLFEWLSRALPGGVITALLEIMISSLHRLQLGPLSVLGKGVEMALAYLMALAILSLLGVGYALTLARLGISGWVRGSLAGLVLWLPSLALAAWGGWGFPGAALGGLWLLGLSLVWGLALGWGIDQNLALQQGDSDPGRRRFLIDLGLISSLLVSGLIAGLARLIADAPSPAEPLPQASNPATPAPTATQPLPQPGTAPAPTPDQFLPVPGTRPEVTPIDRFYRVDINLLPPSLSDPSTGSEGGLIDRLRAQGETEINREAFTLIVEGLVDQTLRLSLEELRGFPIVEQLATLECISNPIAGDLIGTTSFQGARLRDVLDRAGLKPEALDIKFICVDGYTESLPLESARDPRTLLCYGMGGQPLSADHGFPLRLYTPDRFGMKNPKWIIKLVAVAEDYRGYWEQRGWSEDAWVQTTSVIDIVEDQGGGSLLIGGMAYSGARGIQQVELRLDEGAWIPARLKEPPSPLTWVLWRAQLSGISSGRHRLTVRCVDGENAAQTEETNDNYPDGATGYHSILINVEA